MPIFEKAGRRIAFIHIPKAAGTSIEQFFQANEWSMSFYKQCDDPSIPSDHHFTYETLRERISDLDSMTSFCIVRNPYSRAVSEWRWQTQAIRLCRLNFEDFMRRVEVSLRTSKTYFDNHWRPQSDFLDENINSIIPIESLAERFQEFCVEHDLDATSALPRAGRVQPTTRSFVLEITEESLQRIRRIYARDFETLNYSLEVPSLR